jgi:hypothetical protein
MLDCVDVAFVPDETLDQLPLPSQIGATKVGGLDLNKPRVRTALHADQGGCRSGRRYSRYLPVGCRALRMDHAEVAVQLGELGAGEYESGERERGAGGQI